MTRPTLFSSFVFLVSAVPLIAQPPAKDVTAVLGVQKAISAAREHLRASRPAEAVAVLEAELLNADGNSQFLNLLHDAYVAQLRDLQLQRADGATIESLRHRLKALEGKAAATADVGPAIPMAATPDAAALVRPPAPPIPDAPAASIVPPTLPEPSADGGEDPFQQKVREQPAVTPSLSRASEAFAARRYAEAERLFAQAARRQEALSTAQRDEWTYSRLHTIGMRLNAGNASGAELAELARDVEDAVKLGSERVTPFGNQLLAEIGRRDPGAGIRSEATDWQVVETSSFRVLHRSQPALAADVSQTCEAARKAMYERWAGPAAARWEPRCDVYLHVTAADYARATGKPSDNPGHSTIGAKGGHVVSRRIDLRLDDGALMDGTLPFEVTQAVLADLFADQPLPRWALIGMAALSESPEGVARYRRAVPTLLREKKMFAVGPFMDQPTFPNPASVTAFYAESVSLVSYLVELKGPKAFATFLREAPRRGYAKALTSHYGFKDAAELQDRWVKNALGGE